MRKPGLTLLSIATPLLLLFVAGCGAMSAPQAPSTGALVVSAEKATIDTTTTNQLSARLASGASASVNWSIAGGQNDASFGQGTISANGLYTPPPLLSRDQVQIQVMATSRLTRRRLQAICSPLPPDSSRCLRLRPPAWRRGHRSGHGTDR